MNRPDLHVLSCFSHTPTFSSNFIVARGVALFGLLIAFAHWTARCFCPRSLTMVLLIDLALSVS